MLQPVNQLPTLGYVHKVVCDCLGLWNSNSENVTFKISATEKEQRIALSQAFEAIRKENGKYGSFDDLVEVTTQIAPEAKEKIKKNRTIQAYVNHLSKTDFESINEYYELHEYIEELITTRYSRWGVSDLAVSFYRSALANYREFVREHACNAESQNHSYQFFLNRHLRSLTKTLTLELLPNDTWPDTELEEPWPLRKFADTASRITDISLHKLHQYHQFQQQERLNEQAWARDFSSQQVNTRSKQVIERLRKHNRMKWEIFYPTLQPLTHHLPAEIPEKAFAIHAFAAMITHNLNAHIADCGPFELLARDYLSQGQAEYIHSIPNSDFLDQLLNEDPINSDFFVQQANSHYQAMLNAIKTLPGSLNLTIDVPNVFEQIYQKGHKRFSAGAWQISLVNAPGWINEWMKAREALLAGDSLSALSHFKAALEQAKYVAGPLFLPFHIEVCAFCKSQYRLLSERKEEELFERFYECLGNDASKYAALIGYTPRYLRDKKTLLPHTTLPMKTRLIIEEIDTLARALQR